MDEAYRDFFKAVLPYLHARSTDVHVATCLPLVKELLCTEPGPVDEQVVHLAFILHDAGWSQMTEQEMEALRMGLMRTLDARLNDLGLTAFKLNSVDGSLTHSTRFVLVDGARRIRGYYLDTPRLLHDIRQLEREIS